MASSIITLRPVEEDDAVGLAESNRSLNSPHAPTDPNAVGEIIARSQRSISGRHTPTQVNIIAEMLRTGGEKRIVGGGALVKMGSDGEFPILWRPREDGSLSRSRYTDPTLEFGGASVAGDMQGRSIGKAITAVRALIAKKYGPPLFGTRHVLSDFLPPLDSVDTKENAFWNDLIVPLLREKGVLEDIMRYCEEKTGIHIEDTTTLSAVIGNTMSDADRNAMVDAFFPQTIAPKRITPAIRHIMTNVNGPTEAARANLLKIFGSAFKIIGVFPINGGPNYAAPSELGPTGEGPTPLRIQDHVEGSVKTLIFKPLDEGFEGLQKLRATLTDGYMMDSYTIISQEAAEMADMRKGDDIMRIQL